MKRTSSDHDIDKLKLQLDAISLRHCKKHLDNLNRNIPEEKITGKILKTMLHQCQQKGIFDLNDLVIEDYKECISHVNRKGFEDPSDVKELISVIKNIKRMDQFFEPYSDTELTPETFGINQEYKVICPHCGTKAELTANSFKNTLEKIYLCPTCRAYCSTHKDTNIPKGLPATDEERRYRSYVHNLFDQLWKIYGWDRFHAYVWLSRQMKLSIEETHIGLFSVKQCKKALAIVHSYMEKSGSSTEEVGA